MALLISRLSARLYSNQLYYISVLFFGVMLGVLFPLGSLEHIPLCMIKLALGFDCPGCGMSRSWIYLFHGQFIAAAKLNVAVFPLAAIILISLVNQISFLLRGRLYLNSNWLCTQILSPLLLILLISQWVMKFVT